MSVLKELLDQNCSDGVEYVRLGDVAEIGTGRSDRKDATEDGEFPFFVRSEHVLRFPSFQFDEEALIIPGEGNVGEVFHYINGKYALHQRAYRVHFLSDAVNCRFALYALESHFKQYINKRAVSATVKSLRKPMITEFPLAVPPRAVQDKIVEYIDTFAAVCDNLDLEIEQRERQLEALRFQLLQRFAVSHTDRAPLGDVVKITNGRDWKDQEPGEVPVYGSGGLMDARVAAPAGVGPAVLLPRKGSLDVQYVDGPFWNIDTVFRTSVDETVLLPKFFYYAASEFDLESISTSSTRPSLTQKALKKLVVPLPPLSVQQEISDKLDTMQQLIDNLKHERELRGKQFEYYRSRLLDFTAKEPEDND